MERDFDDDMGSAEGILTAAAMGICFYLIAWMAFLN